MSSYGYQSDHINLIADNLRDRYESGFPILKELIQNADDAGAKRLVFGLHPGFKGKRDHPLLQGTGLWVFNDGRFKKEDERAIRSFGLNSKAGEAGAIGKFGLGMKSVFHLCEAFFYIASDGENVFDVFMNPWSGTDVDDLFHNAWNEVEPKAYTALREVVVSEGLDQRCTSWFMMWIPLRQRTHVPQKDGRPFGGIVDKYIGDPDSKEMHFLSDASLSRKIQAILPLLRHLETIELKHFGNTPGFKLQLSVDENACRVDHSTSDLVSIGDVALGGDKSSKLRFFIQQASRPGIAPFSELQQLDAWPKTGRLNTHGIREAVPDKSVAEGAVLISSTSTEDGISKIDINWAVFLPLEKGLSYEFLLPGGRKHYRIALHGQFFVDAGRRGIAGFSHLSDQALVPSHGMDDTDLHLGWNQAVAQKIVLPMLLPTLAKFAQQHLNDAESEEFARGILFASARNNTSGNGKGFFETYKNYLCDDQAWVRMITIEGPKWSYQRLSSDTRIVKLPRPPKHDLDRPWKVLPGLRKLAEIGWILIDEDAPSLMKLCHSWEENELVNVLSSVDLDQACAETGLKYLISFLKLENRRYLNSGDVQKCLCALVRGLLQREQLQTFRNYRSLFQELIALIKPEYRVAFGARRADAGNALDEETLRLLIDADIEKLVLPLDLDAERENASNGRLTDNDLRILLTILDSQIAKFTHADEFKKLKKIGMLLHAASLILDVVDEKNGERARTLRVNGKLRILSAICARTNKEHAVSFEELQSCNLKGVLFRQGFPSERGGYFVASALATLLPTEQIFVVKREISNWLFQHEQNKEKTLPLATEPSATYSALGRLGSTFSLAGPEIRSHFLRSVKPSDLKDEEVRRGVRYLLHGDARYHSDQESTLWINADKSDTAWIKLKRMIDPQSWNLVDPHMASAIPRDDWDLLGIKRIEADSVISRLRYDIDLSTVISSDFSNTEILEVLNRVEDERLWRSLPLHVDIHGNFGPITNNCYIDPNNLSHASLFEGIRLIKLSDNKKLLERQHNFISRWSPVTTIQRTLLLDVPSLHWKSILRNLGDLSASEVHQIANLRDVSWLPLAKDGCIAPCHVIRFEQLDEDIDRLASEAGYCYSGILGISDEVREGPNFDKLKSLFACDAEALQLLGQLMSNTPGYAIGEVAVHTNLLSLIDSLSKLSSLPGWKIIKKVVDVIGSEQQAKISEHLLKEVCHPLSIEKLIEVLNEVSSSSFTDKATVFNLYLTQLASDEENASRVLRQIKLRARDGKWASAESLCIGVHGVAKSCLLDEEQGRILGDLVDRNVRKPDERSLDSEKVMSGSNDKDGTYILSEFFRPWRELMPSGPIGVLFSLIGPRYRDLAVEWLKPHTFDFLVEQLGWLEPGDRNSPVWDYKRREHTKYDALEMLDFIPEIFSEDEIQVSSLTGSSIMVQVDSSFDTLLVGQLRWAGARDGLHRFRMKIRKVTKPEQYEKPHLSQLIRKTCEAILTDAYNQRDVQLGQMWTSIEKSNQLELEVARSLILDRLPFDLRNLKAVKKNPRLVDWLDNLKQLETSRAEKKANKQGIEAEEKKIAEAKLELSQLMARDSSCQNAVLNGIRERVEQNQYSPSSIAFELFQNADDAVLELQSLVMADSLVGYPTHQVGRFVMESSNKVVRFIHWGRPVNYMGHGEGHKQSYGEDLQRMLILAASDKDENTGLTGKFGLGFKSVLLATDAPCVLSGDLKTKIVGGCLPEVWQDAHDAVDSLQRHRLDDAPGLRGTVVEFKLNSSANLSDISDRFRALAGLQGVFSKEIRTIQIDDETYHWADKVIDDDILSMATGIVKLPGKEGLDESRIVNLQFADACVALRVGSRGFTPFQSKVENAAPSIWVTAPTLERAATGLILNAQFELDTGRGGLPGGDGALRNLDRAKCLGVQAAEVIYKAVQKTRLDWEQFRPKLGLIVEVSDISFWASFWKQIPVRENDVDSSEASRLLHQFGQAMYVHFVELAEEIPNGLQGERASYVQRRHVCLALSSRWEKLYEPLAKWADLSEAFPKLGWVSDDVADQLKANFEDLQVSEMSVKFLLSTVPQGRCGPEVMNVLSQLLTELTPEENEQVRIQMGSFYFNSMDGDWQLGRHLLKKGTQFDDQFILFASPSRLLDTQYEALSHSLISQYARVEEIENQKIASWIISIGSEDFEARVAALRYLLHGHGARVYVQQWVQGTWLESFDHTSIYLEPFTDAERKILLAMFIPTPVWDQQDEPVEEDEIECLTGDHALTAINNWWKQNAHVQLAKFDREFWPSSIPRRFESVDDDRASWMTLFAIGLMQRHGRVRDQQNRGFIDKMQSKGFWDVFCYKDPRVDGDLWLNVLKEYGDQQTEDEEYSAWMDNFPRFYRVARWFDVYAQIFQSVDRREQSQISSMLSPSADPHLSGSGIHAPSMTGSFKLGKHVIIRELLRAGELHGTNVRSLAYKPGEAVKRLLVELGFDELNRDDVKSEDIYKILVDCLGEDATFQGAYDIPLIILSRDEGLLRQILQPEETEEEPLYG